MFDHQGCLLSSSILVDIHHGTETMASATNSRINSRWQHLHGRIEYSLFVPEPDGGLTIKHLSLGLTSSPSFCPFLELPVIRLGEMLGRLKCQGDVRSLFSVRSGEQILQQLLVMDESKSQSFGWSKIDLDRSFSCCDSCGDHLDGASRKLVVAIFVEEFARLQIFLSIC